MKKLTDLINLIAAVVRLIDALIPVRAGLDLLENALTDPANDGDRLAVPDRLVARAVRAFAGWLAAPRDQRVVVWHALEAFALAGKQSADFRFDQRVGLVTATACSTQAILYFIAEFGGTAAISTAERYRNRLSIKHGVFLPVVPAERMSLVETDTWVLCTVHNKMAMTMVGILARATLQTSVARIKDCSYAGHIVVTVATRLASSAGKCRRDEERLALNIQPAVFRCECRRSLDRAGKAVTSECRDPAKH